MSSEVGSGQVAIVPTFRGFRKAVATETDGATKASASSMSQGFTKAGATSGKGFAQGFKSTAATASTSTLKTLSTDVAKFSREVSASRLKEQDATGKLRVAEAQLAEARRKHAGDSSQVVRAEERVASAQRAHLATQSTLVGSTDRLATAQRNLASATSSAASAGTHTSSVFRNLPSVFSRAGASSATSFGSAFRSNVGQIFTGAALAGFATQGAFALGRTIGDGINAGVSYSVQGVGLASDLEQSNGATVSVFKDQADAIFAASKTAATGVGISRAAYLKYSTVVGAQLKNLGLPIDQVSGKTNELISLGADLAAQFGGQTSDAVAALSSLLRGERDPIERYGVGLKQVDIDARLAAKGQKELTGEQLKQAEIQATLELLWAQTSDAQGTFFRESDTYAHKTQVLNAQLEESKTRLGESLMPAFSAAASYLNDTVLPAFDGVIDRVGPKLGDALTAAAPQFEKLLEAVGPLVDKLTDAGVDALPGVIDGFTDLAEAAPEWIEAYQSIDQAAVDFTESFYDLQDSLKQAREDRISWFDDLLQPGDGETTLDADPWLPAAEDAGQKVGLAFNASLVGGIQQGAGSTRDAALQLADDAAQSASSEAVTEFHFAGKSLVDGFVLGMQENGFKSDAAAVAIAVSATAAAKKALQIRSPSGVWRNEVGAQVPAGMALGMADNRYLVEREVASLVAVPAVASLSESQGSTSSTASTLAGRGQTVMLEQKIYPQPRQSEQEIGDAAAARLEFDLRGLK